MDRRHRRAHGGWLLAAQFLTLPLTVVAIVLLLVVLGVTLRRLVAQRPESPVDLLLMDGAVGIHLGWVSLATVANITAWLAADVVAPMDADAQQLWGVLVLVVVALVGAAIAFGTDGRIAPALAMAWGLVWIGIARSTGEPHAPAVATTAFIVAAVVLAAAIGLRARALTRALRRLTHAPPSHAARLSLTRRAPSLCARTLAPGPNPHAPARPGVRVRPRGKGSAAERADRAGVRVPGARVRRRGGRTAPG